MALTIGDPSLGRGHKGTVHHGGGHGDAAGRADTRASDDANC